MTQQRNEEAVRALLAQNGRPQPDAAFAARLRAQFVSGSIPARGGKLLNFPPQMWLFPLAAAALLLLWLNRSPASEMPWEVRAHRGLEYVLLDGQRVEIDRLEGQLRPGRLLALPPYTGGTLELISEGRLYFELEHAVKLRLPSLDGRNDGELSGSGQLRVVTGPRFHGSELFLRAPRAEWRVTGTAFTAIVDGEALCLCVMEGEVEACERGETMEPVPAGRRFTIVEGAEEPDRGEMVEAEREALLQLVSRAQAAW